MSDIERDPQRQRKHARTGAHERVIEAPDPETPAGGDPDLEPASGDEAGLWTDAWQDLKRNKLFMLAAFFILVMVVMALFPQAFTWFYPGESDVSGRACSLSNSANVPGQGRPSAAAWFGYDIQGCDYYLRTIHGARVSMSVGILVVGGALIVAVVFGSIAGFYGRSVDALIARLTDVWFAIPTLLGAIVVLSVLGKKGVFEVSLVLILLGWPSMLRLMRSSVLSVKEMDYVHASRALGARDGRLIIKHILPNAMAPVIVYATIFVGVIIAAEAALSFLGVGVQLPAITWGLMINIATRQILNAPHLLFFPGVFLAITVFGFILMGDVLRDALDPKLR